MHQTFEGQVGGSDGDFAAGVGEFVLFRRWQVVKVSNDVARASLADPLARRGCGRGAAERRYVHEGDPTGDGDVEECCVIGEFCLGAMRMDQCIPAGVSRVRPRVQFLHH